MTKVRIYGVYLAEHPYKTYKYLVTGISGDFDSDREITGFMFNKYGELQSMFTILEHNFIKEVGYIYIPNNKFKLKLESVK